MFIISYFTFRSTWSQITLIGKWSMIWWTINIKDHTYTLSFYNMTLHCTTLHHHHHHHHYSLAIRYRSSASCSSPRGHTYPAAQCCLLCGPAVRTSPGGIRSWSRKRYHQWMHMWIDGWMDGWMDVMLCFLIMCWLHHLLGPYTICYALFSSIHHCSSHPFITAPLIYLSLLLWSRYGWLSSWSRGDALFCGGRTGGWRSRGLQWEQLRRVLRIRGEAVHR